jgi:hypothetical protein
VAVQTSRTATFSVFMQLRTVDPTYYRVFTRQLRTIVMFFSIFLKLSFTHREKRDLLRLRDCFRRENTDETFRTHVILRKGVKTVESLLFHAFKFESWEMGSKTSRKSENRVCPRVIFFLQSIYGPEHVRKATTVGVFVFILSGMRVQHPKVYVPRVFRYILNCKQ